MTTGRAEALIVPGVDPLVYPDRSETETRANAPPAVHLRREELRGRRVHIAYGPNAADLGGGPPCMSTRSSRGPSRGPARRAADEVRAGDQPEDGEGPRANDPAITRATSRPCHRVNSPGFRDISSLIGDAVDHREPRSAPDRGSPCSPRPVTAGVRRTAAGIGPAEVATPSTVELFPRRIRWRENSAYHRTGRGGLLRRVRASPARLSHAGDIAGRVDRQGP